MTTRTCTGVGLSHQDHCSRRRSASPGQRSERVAPGSRSRRWRTLGLGLIASCVACVCSGRDEASTRRSAKSTPSASADDPEGYAEPNPTATAPDVVHAFGDGAACEAIGSCRLLEVVAGESGTTWRLASASSLSDARIELTVTPDSSQISAISVAGAASGDLAALIVEDLQVSEGDRKALAWYVRERLGDGELEEAEPLCATGICVSIESSSGVPAAHLLLGPEIEADRRSMKRATKAAAKAARLEARKRSKERSPAGRRQRTHAPQPRRAAAAPVAPPRRSCCKYCSKGIPCGNTCIAANRTCHKGSGCAC